MNLFANCVLVLDARPGERQWHYQTVHHDIFDYDNPPAPILATIRHEGEPRDVAVRMTKMGDYSPAGRESFEQRKDSPSVGAWDEEALKAFRGQGLKPTPVEVISAQLSWPDSQTCFLPGPSLVGFPGLVQLVRLIQFQSPVL
jgi:hypothetical protein